MWDGIAIFGTNVTKVKEKVLKTLTRKKKKKTYTK